MPDRLRVISWILTRNIMDSDA